MFHLLYYETHGILFKAIEEFLEKHDTDFPELQKFMLASSEWDALEIFQRILEVRLRSTIKIYIQT